MKHQTHLSYLNGMLLVFSGILLVLVTNNNVVLANRVAVINYSTTDFDGDRKSDISVFRPSDGYWHILKSSGGSLSVKWGFGTDTLVPGDYDGDFKTDFAVYRFGIWYILKSSDNSLFALPWGLYTNDRRDIPVPADYDGDYKTDPTFYTNPDYGPVPINFLILQSSINSVVTKQWGTNIDRIIPADYDGDGKADPAVFRDDSWFGNQQVGVWFILQSSNNQIRVERFGLPTDLLVPADYDGDGRADIAVYRPSNGFWYRINSSDGTFSAFKFGLSEDKPVPADYDGDKKTDIAVFRPSTGIWYLQRSTAGFLAQHWGRSDDVPIPNVFVR